jgi:hypothetical protein
MQLSEFLTQPRRKLKRPDDERDCSRNAMKEHQKRDRRITLAEKRVRIQQRHFSCENHKQRHEYERQPPDKSNLK